MNYDSALVVAKQRVCSTGIERVITEKGDVYMTKQWPGKVVFTVRAEGKNVVVIGEKGKVVSKTPLKKVKPKVEKPKKDE